MLTDDFDFHLPEGSIAQRPLARGESRLLVLDAAGDDRHRHTRDLPDLLQPGDLVVVNDTRVLPARLFGKRRPGGGKVEILLAEKLETDDDATWDALLKPGRRARPGTVIDLDDDAPGDPLSTEVLAKGDDGRYQLRFSEPIEPHLERLGHIPLPPYIKRDDDADDRTTYQTVFARQPGAIAAPTAGLHFDETFSERLAARGIGHAAVTLHVGLGTFKPVTAALVHEHHMDEERYHVSTEVAEAIHRTRARGGRIVAIGTTVVRTLESAAQRTGAVEAGGGRTDLFINPGYDFRAVDVLLTNFHLPKSTLLMLVSALAGRNRVLDAYREAVDEGYRFYSYGDAMLVSRR